MKFIPRFALIILVLDLHAATPIPESCKVGGFALGCQAYCFNRYTLFEAIDKTKAAGGKTIELSFLQKLSSAFPNVDVDVNLSDEHIRLLKEKLGAAGIRATGFYFRNTAFAQKDPEAALRKVFEFARKLDLVALIGEPPESGFDLIEKLCNEYDIRFCLHNHRKNEAQPDYRYWNPAYTFNLMKYRDAHMGFCLDTGHLVRSGVEPVDALKLLQGRVYTVHLKDPIDATGHDTIFGEGVGDVRGVLQELKRQKFDGYITIEYENNWTNSVPDIKQCVDFVRREGRDVLQDKKYPNKK